MALYPGFCVIHKQFAPSAVSLAKAAHPQAKFLAHPECDISVSSMADFVGSTAAMLNYVVNDPCKYFIIGTEAGILHQMKKARPDAEFAPIPVDSGGNAPLCPYMRLNTLEKIYLAIRDLRPEIALDGELCQKALAPLQRMLSLG
jgi:quinolinate synthase